MKKTPGQEASTDRLAAALKGTGPVQIRTLLEKTETVQMRVTEADKASMAETANSLGLTLTDFLTRLHLFAVEALAKDSRKGRQ